MNRLLRPFRSLGWKLTLSYTLVTVAALLLVEVIVLGIGVAVAGQSGSVLQTLTALVAERVTPQVRPFLEGPEPDLSGLDQWLDQAATQGLRVVDAQGETTNLGSLRSAGGQLAGMLVLDAQGGLLSARPPEIRSADVPGLAEVLPAALAGEQDASQLYAQQPDGTFVIAAPVRAADGRLLGAFILTGVMGTTQTIIPQVLSLLGGSALVLTLGAGVIGTLFGFFTARGLTRRLRGVSSGAAAWGRGDFAARIGDRSGDELGQLSRQLDAVAGELEALVDARQQLAALEERNRLARDLHDSVKQQVFAISMNLGTAQALWASKPEEARAALDTAAGLARQAQRELGALIQALRPLQLQGQGLAQAVRDLVQGWEKQSGVAAICQVQGSAVLPVEVEQALFRIAQEGLANIARHSGATAATLTLTLAPGEAALELRDNGRGFDPAQVRAGLGLRSMQERAQAVGGRLTVESGSQGTHLTARVPLEEVP